MQLKQYSSMRAAWYEKNSVVHDQKETRDTSTNIINLYSVLSDML